jgi:hypothetical protein
VRFSPADWVVAAIGGGVVIAVGALYLWIRRALREAIEGPRSLRLSLPLPDNTAAYVRVTPLSGSDVSSEALVQLIRYIAGRQPSQGPVPVRLQYIRGAWLPVVVQSLVADVESPE